MRIIVATDVSTVTQKLVDILQAANGVGGAGTVVERSEEVSENDHLNGWIGIYRAMRTFVPRTLGVAAGYRYDNISLVLLFKCDSLTSGADCENMLESVIKETVSVILTDPSIGGTVANVDGDIRIVYEGYTQLDTVFTQRAVMYLTLQTTTGVVDL